MNLDHRPVSSAVPVAGYIGGKRNLARRLIARIETIPHDGYAEAFVGMGGVFLRRPSAPKVEVINDLNGDVAGFFRILQRHYSAFLEMLRFQVTSRREFERLALIDPTTLTDLERAARFLYLQRLAFGGKVVGQNFGVSKGQAARFNVLKLVPMLEDLHERLAGVVIEQLDWRAFFDRYDRPGMLFYLDPPYYGTEHFYGRDAFQRSDFAELAERLGKLKGSFVLSLNDHPDVREIFGAFDVDAVPVSYTVSQGGAAAASEVIITPRR